MRTDRWSRRRSRCRRRIRCAATRSAAPLNSVAAIHHPLPAPDWEGLRHATQSRRESLRSISRRAPGSSHRGEEDEACRVLRPQLEGSAACLGRTRRLCHPSPAAARPHSQTELRGQSSLGERPLGGNGERSAPIRTIRRACRANCVFPLPDMPARITNGFVTNAARRPTTRSPWPTGTRRPDESTACRNAAAMSPRVDTSPATPALLLHVLDVLVRQLENGIEVTQDLGVFRHRSSLVELVHDGACGVVACEISRSE